MNVQDAKNANNIIGVRGYSFSVNCSQSNAKIYLYPVEYNNWLTCEIDTALQSIYCDASMSFKAMQVNSILLNIFYICPASPKY